MLSFSTPCLPLCLFGVFTKLVGGHQREPLIFSLLGGRLNHCLPVYFFCMHVINIWKHNVTSSHPRRQSLKGSWGSCSSTLSGKGTSRPTRVKGPGQACIDSEGQSCANLSFWAVRYPAFPQSSHLVQKQVRLKKVSAKFHYFMFSVSGF